ncbi:MAG: DUF2752 domain-containing protein [Bacteroidales bacterium]|jgi:hypothetical protein|nr:DUF2752 domain-containing protein [Bacteroidales bacterium]
MTLAWLISIADWLESHQLPCFYRAMFHIECPGCGMQRALVALLRGDGLTSFRLHPALIPTIIVLAMLALHLTFKFRNGGRILLYLLLFDSLIITVNYIHKLFYH